MLAAVGVRVALEGREPDLEEWPDCVLQHVFHDVQLGSHEVKVTDAVGFPETLGVCLRNNVLNDNRLYQSNYYDILYIKAYYSRIRSVCNAIRL